MSTRFFVLATVTTLAGLFATIGGCSSSSTGATTGADAGDSGPKPPGRDSGPAEDADAGPATCPSADPVTEADLGKWQPPPATEDVCRQADVDRLKAAFAAATSGVKYTDIKTALGATCAACVFSPQSFADGGAAPTWSVFVEGSTAGSAVDNRSGSCFAHLKDDACGKGRYLFEACLRVACTTENCGTDTKVSQCKKDVQKGACKALTTAYAAACPNETELIAACNTYSAIAYGCSGGPDGGAEGGIDASL